MAKYRNTLITLIAYRQRNLHTTEYLQIKFGREKLSFHSVMLST